VEGKLRIGKRRKKKRFIPVLVTVGALFLLVIVVRLFLYWNTPAEDPGREVTVEIQGGSTFISAAQKLRDEGVIRSIKPFVLLGKIKGLSNSIQAGELRFRTDMTPVEVLDILSRGKAVVYSVTLPEGYTARQARNLGIPADRLEGFLFPDTYSWPKGTPEEDLLRRMVTRYQDVFDDSMRARAQQLGMTELEVVTLASIVERETGVDSERALVSAVFHNRLAKGYRLQTDPAVIYGLKDFDGNLTKKQLRKDTPYNTYTRMGLPPGPIANPGSASLKATLYPEDVSYLYFVSKGDGTHIFSNTLVEHNKAVKEYQLGK
jgi:UPF0755 protein